MPRRIRLIGLIILSAWINGGCMQVPSTPAAPSPTISILYLQYTPSLEFLVPFLHDCAVEDSRLALILEERPTSNLDLSQTNFILRFGAPASLTDYAAIIGQDRLIFIVNPSNPVQTLSPEQIRSIFSAKLSRWEQIVPQTDFTGEIQVWSYPDGEDIQRILQQSFGVDPLSPSVFLAPNPIALRTIISNEPLAFGFIPSRLLDSSIKALDIEDSSNLEPFPIILIAPHQPQGIEKNFILCVQETLNPIHSTP